MKAINTMTMSEMVKEYNKAAKKVGKKTIKKFRDRDTAISRTTAMLAEAKGTKTKSTGTKGKGGRAQVPYPWPASKPEFNVREGSLRGVLVAKMKDGATEAQLQNAAEKHYADAGKKLPEGFNLRVQLRTINKFNGYGIREKDGKLFAVNPK